MGRNRMPDLQRRKQRTLYLTDVEYSAVIQVIAQQRGVTASPSFVPAIPTQQAQSVQRTVKPIQSSIMQSSVTERSTVRQAQDREYTPILKDKEKKLLHGKQSQKTQSVQQEEGEMW